MKKVFVLVCALLMAFSIAAGLVYATDEKQIPVVLADGSVITPPWNITVDGEKVALVESEEAAQKTLNDIIEEYNSKNEEDNVVLDIEIKETTEVNPMKIEHGDENPEIMTVREAKEKLMKGDDGDGYITVVTTEEQVKKETIEFEEEYKAEPDLYVGETKVETEGREGSKKVTKKVVKENGETVDEEVTDEEVIKEPQEQIVLAGTRTYDGYGGGEYGEADAGVSYDRTAIYSTLGTPVDKVYVSSWFGQRWGRLHRGIDFALAQGSNIYAADGGKVYFVGVSGGYGNVIKVDHGNGMQTYYAHCSKMLVSQGQSVARGEVIGLVGSTGNSTGSHLHFEVIVNGGCVNPAGLLGL
ncbi:MAG: peptidoglycan DD-metalloendopeptidase family protein [Clostridiales bacterium]|nr:peptidoglycan DD-metalloendopeptidase family protein [Clostridiales bacterium]